MKKKLLILFYLFSFVFIFSKDDLTNKEEYFLETIEKYSEMTNYLTDDEIEVLKKLQKKGLTLGYQTDYDLEVFMLKKMFKKHLGIEVTMIKKPWNKMLEDIQTGKMDMLTNLSYTKEREVYIEYSDPYYTSSVFLVHPTKINLDNLETLTDKSIIFTKGSVHLEAFKDLKDLYNIKLIAENALDLKDIDDDTYLLSDRTKIYSLVQNGIGDYHYKELFNADPIYFGFSRKYPQEYRDLLKKVLNNYLIAKVNDFLNEYSSYLDRELIVGILSSEEVKYIKGLDEIFVGIDKDQYYKSYQEKNSETYRGAWLDIYKHLGNEWIEETYVPFDIAKEKEDFLSENLNAIALMPINMKTIKKYNISSPVYTLEYFLVRNKTNSNDLGTTGISRTSYYLSNFLLQNLDNNYELFDSNIDLIDALEEGRVSRVILSENDLRYFQSEMLKTFLEINRSLGNIEIGIASNLESKDLANILNKYVIHSSVIKEIMKKWSYPTNTIGLKYQKKSDLLVVALFSLAIVLIILIAIVRKLYLGAYYDQIFKLPNKKSLEKNLNKKDNIGLIVFSISNLSDILDTTTMDDAIKGIKNLLDSLSMPVYVTNRNEYIVVVDVKKQDTLYRYMKKLKREVSTCYIGGIALKFHVGISHISTSETHENLIKNGLYSLYLFGKNKRLIIGDPKLLEEHRHLKLHERELEEALIKEKFYPNFQPKVSLKTGRIKGAEALSRYTGEDGKFHSPGIFVPILEEMDLIYKLDLQILKKSLIIVKKWLDSGLVEKDFIISQNLSIKTLEKPEVFAEIEKIIMALNFPVENLEFEVTETALSANINTLSYNLGILKSLGATISLDDFSAGNSSMGYINQLPIDIVKFDMSLLPVSETETNKLNILISFSELFKKLNYKVIAEGIETKWQRDFLSQTSVNDGQGYYYSKPLGSLDFERFIKEYIKK